MKKIEAVIKRKNFLTIKNNMNTVGTYIIDKRNLDDSNIYEKSKNSCTSNTSWKRMKNGTSLSLYQSNICELPNQHIEKYFVNSMSHCNIFFVILKCYNQYNLQLNFHRLAMTHSLRNTFYQCFELCSFIQQFFRRA